jgi:carboxypeptidase-like protein
MKKLGIVGVVVATLALLGGCWLLGPTGTVDGVVIDGTTGEGLADVSVSVEGVVMASAVTDDYGEFSLIAPAGDLMLEFSLDGYDFDSVAVSVGDGEIVQLPAGSIMASPELVGDGVRFILTWGETPYDLDSHLMTPSGHHIYFADSDPSGAGAYLDVDDTSSYGPETITILSQESGTYGYYVYNWSGSPDIATSGAVVRIYDASGLIESVSIPSSGSGLYWNVATLSGSTLSVINEITSSTPSY